MVSERDRVKNLIKYLESLGIEVNIGKNKARGNKGFFMRRNNVFRIDIAKNMPQEELLKVLLHEFAHYFHSKYDRALLSLDFLFGEYTEEIHNELVNVTVKSVPKDFASALFSQKELLKNQIHELSNKIKLYCNDFSLSEKYLPIENNINLKYKYLTKYDSVKFLNKIYSISEIDKYSDLKDYEKYYIELRQKKRFLNRINSKINRINRYYNNISELFARFIELYFTHKNEAMLLAPNASNILLQNINNGCYKEICKLNEILCYT